MKVETIAIIDLGTNTFHLLIAEIDERDEFVVREKFKEPVKLGEGGITAGKIANKAYIRGIKALKKFSQLVKAKGADKIFAFGTSAIRSASNGPQFIAEAKEKTGIDIRVINGNEEAALIFEGVKSGVQLPYLEYSLIVDIGGGSVEFIVAHESKPRLLRSLDLGAARLLEIIQPDNPITPVQLKELYAYVKKSLEGLLKELKEFDISLVVGSSGTFETLGSLLAHQKGDLLASENLNSYRFSRAAFSKVKRVLTTLDREGRLALPGMEPNRVDMIVMGSVIVDILLKEIDVKEVMISLTALKEGILVGYIEDKKARINYLMGSNEKSTRSKAVRNLAKKFHINQDHGVRVSELAISLFNQTVSLHKMGDWERELLKYASLLHDIGSYINRSGHHKHGQYLIMNSRLSGFSNDELIILGNLIRYHRKSLPTRDHFHFKVLRQSQRLMVRVLSGILRIADYLDLGRRGLVEKVKVSITDNVIKIQVFSNENVEIEVNAAMSNKDQFEEVFGRPVEIFQ